MVTALEITDLLALMMVFATALSTYSTWRTQQVTNQIVLISLRPYIGLESIKFVGITNPRVVEGLRNFSTVQAEQTRVSIALGVSEDALSGDSEHKRVRWCSRRGYRIVSSVTSLQIPTAVRLEGKVNLVIETQVRDKGPLGDEHCYLTVYDQRGSLSCDHQIDRDAAS
jgi:hypothetical protein